jgi:tRNA(Ile)-lysidine synthase TilS/MesJ
MFTKDDKILVAVSGGKDSLAVWEILLKLGYDADGFHIDLGIDNYSKRSTEKSVEFAKKLDRKLIIADVKKHFYGKNIFDISKIAGRVPCSVCGLIKRHLMNKYAYDNGYTVLVTGHNLDDESASLFGNIMFWRDNYLASQYPVLPSTDPKLIRKVKPLIYLTEREIAAYNIIRGIDYIYEECPFSEGASSIFMKKELKVLRVL